MANETDQNNNKKRVQSIVGKKNNKHKAREWTIYRYVVDKPPGIWDVRYRKSSIIAHITEYLAWLLFFSCSSIRLGRLSMCFGNYDVRLYNAPPRPSILSVFGCMDGREIREIPDYTAIDIVFWGQQCLGFGRHSTTQGSATSFGNPLWNVCDVVERSCKRLSTVYSVHCYDNINIIYHYSY